MPGKFGDPFRITLEHPQFFDSEIPVYEALSSRTVKLDISFSEVEDLRGKLWQVSSIVSDLPAVSSEAGEASEAALGNGSSITVVIVLVKTQIVMTREYKTNLNRQGGWE